jgi:hypothetical protein
VCRYDGSVQAGSGYHGEQSRIPGVNTLPLTSELSLLLYVESRVFSSTFQHSNLVSSSLLMIVHYVNLS